MSLKVVPAPSCCPGYIDVCAGFPLRQYVWTETCVLRLRARALMGLMACACAFLCIRTPLSVCLCGCAYVSLCVWCVCVCACMCMSVCLCGCVCCPRQRTDVPLVHIIDSEWRSVPLFAKAANSEQAPWKSCPPQVGHNLVTVSFPGTLDPDVAHDAFMETGVRPCR